MSPMVYNYIIIPLVYFVNYVLQKNLSFFIDVCHRLQYNIIEFVKVGGTMTLGEVIKRYREENNLSLREFAEKCGLSHAYIAKLEEGRDPRSGKKIEPTLETVKKVSEAISMPLDELLQIIGYIDRTDDPNPPEKTIDDEIMEIMRELGPDITLQFYELKGMSQEEKEQLKIFLEGLLARRRQKEGKE